MTLCSLAKSQIAHCSLAKTRMAECILLSCIERESQLLSSEIRQGQNKRYQSNFLIFTDLVIESQCPSVCVSVSLFAPSDAVFLGLSLALRSHDQFQASHWSTPPSPHPPKKYSEEKKKKRKNLKKKKK